MEFETTLVSNCCGANITQADPEGHGKCGECGDNCVPETEELEAPETITIATGIEQDIPDLSWKMVFSLVFYFTLYNFLIDNFHYFL